MRFLTLSKVQNVTESKWKAVFQAKYEAKFVPIEFPPRAATAAMEAVMYTWHSEQQVTAKRSGSAMTALSSPNPEAEKEEEGVDLQNY